MPYKLPLFAGTNVRFTGFVFLFQLFFFFLCRKKPFAALTSSTCMAKITSENQTTQYHQVVIANPFNCLPVGVLFTFTSDKEFWIREASPFVGWFPGGECQSVPLSQ